MFADGIHFAYQGGQVRSLLSLLSYLGSGKYRERYLGVKIPPTNLQDYHLDEARKFADGLVSRLADAGVLPAIAPVAGLGRVVCAAPEVATALGYDITAALEEPGGH